MMDELTQGGVRSQEVDSVELAVPLRIEAEDMLSTHYRLESSQSASGNSLISLKDAEHESGKAALEFTEVAGFYDVAIAYFDENDGEASLEVTLDGVSLDAWQLDQNLGSGSTSPANLVHRTVATELYLEPGTLIEILGTAADREFARVDYVELVPTEEQTELTPTTMTVNLANSQEAESEADSSAPQSLQLGTNLNSINYWSSQLPFQDSFKSSRPWRTLNEQWRDIPLDLDENGWLKSLPNRQGSPVTVETVLHKDSGGYRSGTYVVLYDGEGTLHYHTDAQKDEAASRPGREVIEVSPSEQGIFITLNDTDPNNTGNYLRNLRIVPLEQENSSERFTPEFLDKVEAFDTFRFMDWMNTNNSKQQHWDARPTPDSATWTKAGVPVEIMVELANRTDTDPWFNMPHQATDDYMTQFAEYVQENLDPHLNVYVEYSNEVWNTRLDQNLWVEQQVPAAPDSLPKETKIIDWYSRRTTQMTQIWDEVFEGDKERVIGVMGAQAANLTVGERALEYAWSSEDLSHSDLGIDAIAIAPYFGEYIGQPQYESQVEQWTKEADGGLNKLFDELTQGGVLKDGPAGGALQQASTWIENYAELAEQENLELLAYEGGQSVVGKKGVEDNQAVTDLFQQANRDSRMGDVYRDYLERWSELDGGLLLHFSDISRPNKSGSWGALEHVFDDSSPKYDALVDLTS